MIRYGTLKLTTPMVISSIDSWCSVSKDFVAVGRMAKFMDFVSPHAFNTCTAFRPNEPDRGVENKRLRRISDHTESCAVARGVRAYSTDWIPCVRKARGVRWACCLSLDYTKLLQTTVHRSSPSNVRYDWYFVGHTPQTQSRKKGPEMSTLNSTIRHISWS